MSKLKFYLLSFTWGLPMNIIGGLVALVLILCGKRPKRWNHCFYFEVGEDWGGVELGIFFITNKNPSKHIKNHEFGHGIQNCWWGPLFPFVIAIPSAIRYWYRELVYYINEDKYWDLPDYDDIWFEGQATRLGTKYNKEEE